ncbi:MAG: protein kinase, partial [Planctomycetaceae bacterium]|nr:protein kinase [Planctomycetaceae bacterium]
MVELLDKNWLAIDERVDAFELAWSSDSVPNPRDFLPPTDDENYSSILQEILRVDIEYRWSRKLPRSLDQYRSEFPELAIATDLFVQIAYEDYRTRKQAGESVTPEEYAERYGFPLSLWPSQHRRVATTGVLSTLAGNLSDETAIDQVVPDFLKIGEQISGFQLLGELGRGAFSRVYLARQGDLANRPVVLKISTESFGEAERLAKLQHTHIVPIYSVHGMAGLTAVCMPYYGALTFEDLLTHVRLRIPKSGAELAALLKTHRKFNGSESGEDSANWSVLEKASYVEAVLRIGADLATALQHAHERGIVHRDIKPANLLLADDGRPMLMDFNLSEEI